MPSLKVVVHPVPLTPVNHTSWMAVVTAKNHPKSVSNRYVIEFLVAFLCSQFLFWRGRDFLFG